MSQRSTFKSYQIILEMVNSTYHASFEEIKDKLEDEGITISARTLQRYFQHIREEFGIEICYDKPKNLYYIDESHSLDVNAFLRYLGMMQTGETLGMQANQQNMQFIAMDNETGFKGIEWMDPLLKAMRTHKWIEMTYRKFNADKAKTYELQPYLLKEYQSRWYLFARLGDGKAFRTFGLDRIQMVKLTKNGFVPDPAVMPKQYFNDIVGLVYDNDESIQDVQIAVDPTQAAYLKSLPLHHSQTEIGTEQDKVIFNYRLIPNFELIQKLLMQSEFIRVIKPLSLRKEIARIGKQINKNNS